MFFGRLSLILPDQANAQGAPLQERKTCLSRMKGKEGGLYGCIRYGWGKALDTKIIRRANYSNKLNNHNKLKLTGRINVDASELPQRLIHGKGTTNSER